MMDKKKYSRTDLIAMGPNGHNKVLLDLGCGSRKKDGYIGLDIAEVDGVDIVCNLENGLPFEDNSIDEIYSNFLFEHIENIVKFFQEIYRICSNGAIIEFKVPHYMSIAAFKDPTHKTFFTEETMRYFSNDKWYGSDYGINTNFELLDINYEFLEPFNKRRFSLIRNILRKHLWNVVHSMTIRLKVIK